MAMEFHPPKVCISNARLLLTRGEPTIIEMLAEQLVGEARERRKQCMAGRERLVDGVSAGAFLIAALLIARFLPSERGADLLLMLGILVGYAVVSRVRFEFANSYVSPEQIVFMAMLVLLPLNLIPLLVAVAGLLATLPDITRNTWHRERWITSISDSWFSIGPVVVLAALAPGPGTLGAAEVYLLAFAAQLAGDVGWNMIRARVLFGHSAGEVLRTSAQTAQVDAILAPLGFTVAVLAVDEPAALMAAAPLIWLLELFSRDRTARYTATLELNRAYRGTVMMLSDVVEFDDAYTGTHSKSVVDLVRSVAEQMKVPSEERQELEFAALLHDVGKISIPKEILNKPAALSDAEFEIIKTHTIEGQFMLDRIGGLLGRVGEIVRSCHERWDGGGYPDGLRGHEIPLAARIVFACDAYNAMTTDRPYRDAMPRFEALVELSDNAGEQFDPAVVAAVIEVVNDQAPMIEPSDEIRALLSATGSQPQPTSIHAAGSRAG
jgi:HD-GYP domain-containing protein (c-di-GMP phosphodiesterase class II)